MKLLVHLLISLYASSASAWSQDTDLSELMSLEPFEFKCGFSSEYRVVGTSGSTPDDYRQGEIKTLILFGKLKGAKDPFDLQILGDREGVLNQSADSLLSVTHEGSLAHYFHKMSDGTLTLVPSSGGIKLTRYESVEDIRSDYIADCSNWHSGLKNFVTEVLKKADSDNSVDFSDIDLVAVIIPIEFAECTGGTAFLEGIPVNDNVTVPRVITATELQSFPLIVGILAHEYGHVMELPELYDRTDSTFADEGAGIGLWGVMGKGPVGWRRGRISEPARERYFGSGPTSMSVWSQMKVGWIAAETVSADRPGVQLHDVNSDSGKVLKIPVLGSSTEYFLVANRQNTYPSAGSYYDDYAPASGLAIWHIDETVHPNKRDVNIDEAHKRVDLECADGLFSDKGYPSNAPNSVSGGDNLDYWSPDATYASTNNGNLGDATDLWGSGSYTAFTPYTNPSTAGYSGSQQRVFTGILVQNIQALSGGVVQFDIRLLPLAPQNLTATPGDGQVTLSWDAPSSAGGSALTRYEYRYQASGGSWSNWSSTGLVPTTTKTQTGLVNDTAYTFEVRAANAGGSGEAAHDTAIPQASVVESKPGSPRNFSATPGDGQVTLSWDPPAPNGGSAITRFEYRYKMGDGGWYSWSSVGLALGTTKTGLADNTTYTFAVRAVNAHGAGPAVSDTATTLSGSPGPPGVPRNLSATPGIGQVALSWDAPSSDGGSALTGYEYRYQASGGSWSSWSSVSVSTTSRTVTGLAANTAYNFEVRTVNAQGPSTAASRSAMTPAADGPADQPGTVSLTTTAPAVGSAVTATLTDAVTATLTDPDGGIYGASWQWVTSSSGLVVVDGVVDPASPELSSYTPTRQDIGRRLRATVTYSDTYRTGRTAESALTSAVVGLPTAPRNVSMSASLFPNTYTLSWSAPSSDGGLSLTYEYRQQAGNGNWSSWSSVGASTYKYINGLVNGTTYAFQVRARNSQGEGPSAQTTFTPGPIPVSSLAVSAAPNPFNPQTTLRFELPMAGPVSLVVYNLAGQPVRTLLNADSLPAGSHAVGWDARDDQGRFVASGLYLLRWTWQGQTIVQKITLLQ